MNVWIAVLISVSCYFRSWVEKVSFIWCLQHLMLCQWSQTPALDDELFPQNLWKQLISQSSFFVVNFPKAVTSVSTKPLKCLKGKRTTCLLVWGWSYCNLSNLLHQVWASRDKKLAGNYQWGRYRGNNAKMCHLAKSPCLPSASFSGIPPLPISYFFLDQTNDKYTIDMFEIVIVICSEV